MSKFHLNLNQGHKLIGVDDARKVIFEKKELFYMALIIAIYFVFRTTVYRSSLSYFFQMAIVVLTLVLFISKPIMSFPVITILNVLPGQIFMQQTLSFLNHYQLNSIMVIIMLGIMFVYKIFVTEKGQIIAGLNSTYLLVMAILMAISVVGSITPSNYSSEFYMLLLIYASIPFFVETESDVNIIWLSFCVCGVLYAITLFSSLNTVGNIYEQKAISDRNYLAMFGIIALMFLINFVTNQHDSKHSLLSVGAIIVSAIVVWLILSFASRTAFILLILFVALQLLAIFGSDKKVAFIILISVAVLILLVNDSDIASFLFERFQMESTATGNGRYNIVAGFLSGFFESNLLRKLMGYGLNGFLVTGHVAHNAYLGILLDFGMVCFIPFIVVLVKIISGLWKSKYRLFLVMFLIVLMYMGTLDVHTNSAGACFLSAMAGIADIPRKNSYRRNYTNITPQPEINYIFKADK